MLKYREEYSSFEQETEFVRAHGSHTLVLCVHLRNILVPLNEPETKRTKEHRTTEEEMEGPNSS